LTEGGTMNQTRKYYKVQGSGKEIAGLRRTRSAVYRSLDDFLRSIPIAVSNQFGELVIKGARIA
jgi:hypothetical protein